MSECTGFTRRLSTVMVALALGLVTTACSEQSPKAAEGPAEETPAAAAAAAPAPPASSAAGSGAYEGFIDEVSCQAVRGWAWDPSRPNEPLTIALYDGDRLLKEVVADQLRPDLVDGGKGNGKHVFHEATPFPLKDGRPHTVRAVIKGTGHELKPAAGASVSVTCESSGT